MSSFISGSRAPGAIICLMSCQVRFSVAGSFARAFQKLLIQSVFRVAMMSSYTARTSGLASLYSTRPRVAILVFEHHTRSAVALSALLLPLARILGGWIRFAGNETSSCEGGDVP